MCWSTEATPLDAVKGNEAIRDGLLAVTLGMWDHVKNGPREERKIGQPGKADVLDAANWALDWDAPQTMSEVQLIFDTGLHRHLTLSDHGGYTARMCGQQADYSEPRSASCVGRSPRGGLGRLPEPRSPPGGRHSSRRSESSQRSCGRYFFMFSVAAAVAASSPSSTVTLASSL